MSKEFLNEASLKRLLELIKRQFSKYYSKTETEDKLKGKLDAGTRNEYVSQVAICGQTYDGIGHVVNSITITDKNGNHNGVNIFEADLTPKRSSENLITSGAVYDAVEEVSAIAKGRATGLVFDTYEDMVTWLTDEVNVAQLKLGDNLYIRDTDVPDYWWDTDSMSAQPLETQKVDLDEYVKNTDYAGVGKFGVVSVSGSFGVLASSDGRLYISKAGNTDIDGKKDSYRPIVPANLDYAVKSCTNQELTEELTEEQLKLPPSTQAFKDAIGDINTALEEILNPENVITIKEMFENGDITVTQERISRYDTSTKIIEKISDNNFLLYKVDIDFIKDTLFTKEAYVQQSTVGHWLFAITDEDDGYFIAISARAIADKDTIGFTVSEEGYSLNISTVLSKYPTAKYVYVCMERDSEIDWFTNAPEIDEIENVPKIILPKKAIAVEGHEFNIYYDNIMICDNIDNYYVKCSITPTTFKSKTTTQVLSDCFRITPPEGSAGSYTIDFQVCSKYSNKVLTTDTLSLEVIADTSVTDKKVLFIGDSLTASKHYPAEIQHNLSKGGITSLGTITGTVKIDDVSLTVSHEGRSGWSAYDYTNSVTEANSSNAFWNPDTESFDFSYYMTQQGYDSVDVVCLNLGTNGVAYVDRTCNAIDEMITSIHSYDSNIVILVSLISGGASQDGFGVGVGMQSAQEFNFDSLNLVKKYIEKYDGVIDNVDVAEVYFNLDRKNDFSTTEQPLSARNPNKILRQNNNVHPNVYGYLKFADVYYNNILYHLTKESEAAG